MSSLREFWCEFGARRIVCMSAPRSSSLALMADPHGKASGLALGGGAGGRGDREEERPLIHTSQSGSTATLPTLPTYHMPRPTNYTNHNTAVRFQSCKPYTNSDPDPSISSQTLADPVPAPSQRALQSRTAGSVHPSTTHTQPTGHTHPLSPHLLE